MYCGVGKMVVFDIKVGLRYGSFGAMMIAWQKSASVMVKYCGWDILMVE